ncbi:S-acyltransferase [Quillaja saponaria]|uniref:S-acyltransferase n=1 Tax=Quillaja saponaria TaxID=32244 RepID=A0AAD7KZQ6_QUISA|nr:S-acyltransferase [Quillaja saponaria]
MPSIKQELEPGEVDLESMEPIALSLQPEREVPETLAVCDREKEVEVGKEVDNKIGSIVLTLRDKWFGIKRVVEDTLLHYGCAGKLEKTRAYQVWPGKNVFFFHGRLICGPDPRGLMLTSLSIILSSWIFAVYIGEDVPKHSTLIVTFSVILTILVLSNLILVSGIDPGIIPRNGQASLEEVEKFDHHCPWIGQCVGLRNYRFYLSFVMLALVFFVYIFSFSCWRVRQRMFKYGTGILGMFRICPETLALISVSFAGIGFLGGLSIYHVYLIATNQTAYENFRQRYVDSKNPHNKGILSNFKEVLFVALTPSKVDFRAEVTPRL